MTQEKPKSNELVMKESRTRRLAYTPEFKREISLSPHIIRKFLELKQKLRGRGDQKEVESLNIKQVGKSGDAKYYKVETKDKIYFVKEIPRFLSFKGGGVVEMKSLQKIAGILKENHISWAQTVNFKLGFEDPKNIYFVSEWLDCLQTNLYIYREGIEQRVQSENLEIAQAAKSELDDISRKLEKLVSIFEEDKFFDVNLGNMSYDPKSKVIYIFDISDMQILGMR